MRLTVVLTITILALPAFSSASIPPAPRLEFEGFGVAEILPDLEMFPVGEVASAANGQILRAKMECPDDMVSMMSFLWAQLTGSVDLVAEWRCFERRWKEQQRRQGTDVVKNPDTRCRWKIVVGCRVDENLEIAALLNARGRLFRDRSVTWRLSSAGILDDDLGVVAEYRDGHIRLDADDVEMTGTAMAKMVVRF